MRSPIGQSTRIAISGATGFLGQHLTQRLLKEGCCVSILARDGAKAKGFQGRVEKIVIGDIADPLAVAQLVAGANAVIHLASNFRTASGPPESYRAVNLEGTRVMLDAAESANVERFLYCSTIGVHGHVRATPADEQAPYNPGDLYQVTKMEAETLCLEREKSGRMEVVVVRPCSLYGPGDMRMLKMFRMLAKRRFLMLGPCRENFHAVYIDDAVEGFMGALTTPGISGQSFILGGPAYVPLDDYVAAAAHAVNAPRPWIRLPYWPFFGAAALCEAVCVPFGIEPPLHRRRVRFFRNNRAFSIHKASQVLGYSPGVSLEDGLQRTVDWYRQQGHLR